MNLKEIRLAKGLTQKQLAEKSGMHLYYNAKFTACQFKI